MLLAEIDSQFFEFNNESAYVQYFRVWGLLKNNHEEIVNTNCLKNI